MRGVAMSEEKFLLVSLKAAAAIFLLALFGGIAWSFVHTSAVQPVEPLPLLLKTVLAIWIIAGVLNKVCVLFGKIWEELALCELVSWVLFFVIGLTMAKNPGPSTDPLYIELARLISVMSSPLFTLPVLFSEKATPLFQSRKG
jgi:hypothetical protein